MFFAEIERAVLEMVRTRVRNGEITERALARSTGISQPHIHNVLKGTRRVSPALIDQILRQMKLSVLDALDPEEMRRYLSAQEGAGVACLPVLDGELGPDRPWPTRVKSYSPFPVAPASLAAMWQPVLVHTAYDSRMKAVFSGGELVVLDQSPHCRAYLQAGSYYVIKVGNSGVIRQLRQSGGRLFMVAEDVLRRPEGWDELRLHGLSAPYFVRARVTFLGNGWSGIQDFRAASR